MPPYTPSPPPFLLPGFADREVAAEVARLGEVAADLASYLEVGGPDADALAAAPRMEAWSLLRVPECLIIEGIVMGHPRLGTGRAGQTSAIVALGRNGRWARSRNRLWALGTPELPDGAGHA